MLRFLADENLKHQIVVGLRRRLPGVDVATVQDSGLAGAADPLVLERAARSNRVLVTHDVKTVPHFTYERLNRGDPVPGVVVIPDQMSIGRAVQDLTFIAEVGQPADLKDRLLYLPL